MNINTTMIIIYTLLLIMVIVIFISVLRKYKKTRDYLTFILFIICIMGWLIVDNAILFVENTALNNFIWDIGLIFVGFAAVFLPLVFLKFYQPERKLSRNFMILLFIIPSINTIMVLTSLHHSLIRTVEIISVSPVRTIEFVLGPWFWIHTVYSYALTLASVIIITYGHINKPKFYRLPSTLFIIAVSVFIGANVIFNILNIEINIDPTGIGVAIATLLMHLALTDNNKSVLVLYARGQVFKYLNEYILVLNKNGMVIDANPCAANWLASMEIDYYTLSLQGVLSELEKKGATLKGSLFDTSGQDIYFTTENTAILNLNIHEMNDDKDNLVGTIAIFSDVTQNRNALKFAEQANLAKSKFLATMSHEIRTPLNAIIGTAQIQMQDDNLPDKYLAATKTIYNSGNDLLGIINDILDMSKIETGKLEINPAVYDIPGLINDALQLNIVRIGEKPIDFILDINDKVPSKLIGDEIRLKQILNNLLSNAIKYTEKGYVKLSVTYSPLNDKDYIKLCFIIEDSGQGIKSEDKKLLFTEYSDYLRFNTWLNRTTEGTGLGLNITKKLADMMDGSIEVESEYERGSVFTVSIKQKTIECPPIGNETAKKLKDFTYRNENEDGFGKFIYEVMPYGNVLVVDDVEANLYVAKGLLKPYQLKIETAVSGYEAIERIENGLAYDVILMDHMMPDMDGIETTQKIRSLGYKGIIIAFTANALVGNDELFLQNGFDGFISKPIDAKQLNDILNKYIRDRYPEEALKYKEHSLSAAAKQQAQLDPQLLKAFKRDAVKAVESLRNAKLNDNMKLFTTTAHAMKSALANIGEDAASEKAFTLENAGLKNDSNFIEAHTDNFINTLESLLVRFYNDDNRTLKNEAEEDTDFLKKQLEIIKTACENYDDDTAYAAFDSLFKQPWSPKTINLLDELYDLLSIYSDFDGVVLKITQLLKSHDNLFNKNRRCDSFR